VANPILVELTRGDLVESCHTGTFALVRPNGETVAAIGNTAHPVFPRSAVKAFQALPIFETGAADAYGFGDAEIALSCASHSGMPEHAALAQAMLARAGLTVEALACGGHEPMNDSAAKALFKAGVQPSALHNNCSGKHAGMVGACAHCGDPVSGYLAVTHPHQQRIMRVLADFCGTGFEAKRYGIDGCSAPNWAIPVQDLARAFAVFISGHRLSAERRNACARIAKACMARPDMVAGPGRLDTTAMTALPGQVFMKTGAEGVYCGAFPALGLGFALKVDDGNKRASEAIVAGLLAQLYPAGGSLGALDVTRNWMGHETGTTRLSGAMMRVLDQVIAKAA
jgi:L-asparaginase II